jgi:hypothetical protein
VYRSEQQRSGARLQVYTSEQQRSGARL